MLRRRSSDCGPLLEFEEVRRRLHLGTRRDLGVQEIAVAQIIGSVSRAHEFDGCFRPLTDRLRKVLAEIKRAKPNAADSAIAVYQVDHAYFVVDGHKRLSLAVEEGREAIDAEVGVSPAASMSPAGRRWRTSGPRNARIGFARSPGSTGGAGRALPAWRGRRLSRSRGVGQGALIRPVEGPGPCRAARGGRAALVRPRLSPGGRDPHSTRASPGSCPRAPSPSCSS